MAKRRITTCVLAIVTVASLCWSQPASAQTQDPECSFGPGSSSIAVEWSIDLAPGQFVVVERKVFSRFWWRAKSTSSAFTDSGVPRGAASPSYRIKVKSATGKVLRTVDCQLVNNGNFRCYVTKTANGFLVQTTVGLSDSSNDVVFSRRISLDRPWYWRGTSTTMTESRSGTVFLDGPSPTGVAEYRAYHRRDRVITSATTCTEHQPQECFAEFVSKDDYPAASARLQEPDPAVKERLGITVAAFVGPDGDIFYVNPLDDIEVLRVDPSTGVTVSAARFEDYERPVRIQFIDTNGGVYAKVWGGGSRTSAVRGIGVIDNPVYFYGDSDASGGTSAQANLPDGRTLRSRSESDSDNGSWTSPHIYEPLTGEITPICGEGYYAYLATDGSIIVTSVVTGESGRVEIPPRQTS